MANTLLTPEERERIYIWHAQDKLADINEQIGEASVIFNSTGLGKPPYIQQAPNVEYTRAGNGQLWVDLNYRPKLTMFLRKVLKYSRNTTTRVDNAIDLTGYINASHLVYFLSGTEYGQKDTNAFVTANEIYRQTIEGWRKSLKDSELSESDQILTDHEARRIPAWQSDGVPREYVNMADKYGFEVVRITSKEGKISYAIKHKEGYVPPPLNVKGLHLVRGAETGVSKLQEAIIRGGEPGHIIGNEDLTSDGIKEARAGARRIVDNLRGAIAASQVVFITSNAPSTIHTMQTQLEEVNNIVKNNPDEGNDAANFKLRLNTNKRRGESDVIVSPVDIRDRMAGYWGGGTVEDLEFGIGGAHEAVIADAVHNRNDAFGKAAMPGQEGIPPENTIDVIKRAVDFIEYINKNHQGKEVVVYLNGFMTGVLQFILLPTLYEKDEYLNLTTHMPKRALPYNVVAAQKLFNPQAKDKDEAMMVAAANNKGGIDLGRGNYLKVVATGADGVPRFDPVDIRRLQVRLQGVTPIPLGSPRPLDSVGFNQWVPVFR